MPLLRHILIGTTLTTLVLGTTGCRAPDEYPLDVGGCDTTVVSHVQPGSSAVLDVTASGCETITDPVYRTSFAIWQFLPADTRTVRIRTAGPHSPAISLTRADLERTFGPAPQRADSLRPESALWLLLPIVPILPVAIAFLTIRSAARRGVTIFVIGIRE